MFGYGEMGWLAALSDRNAVLADGAVAVPDYTIIFARTVESTTRFFVACNTQTRVGSACVCVCVCV